MITKKVRQDLEVISWCIYNMIRPYTKEVIKEILKGVKKRLK